MKACTLYSLQEGRGRDGEPTLPQGEPWLPKDRKPDQEQTQMTVVLLRQGQLPGEGKAGPSSWFSLQLHSATEEHTLDQVTNLIQPSL